MTSARLRRYFLAILAFASLLGLPPTAVDAGTTAVTWEDVGSDLKASWTGTFDIPLFVSKTMFDDGTNTVTFQAVPEPSAALPALGGAATVLWQVSRRKRPVAQAVASR